MSDILTYINGFLLIISLCVAFYSVIRQKIALFIVCVACLLNGSILSSFMSITQNLFGFGIVWIMIGLVGIFIWLFFRVPLGVGLKHYTSNRTIQVAITLSICYCLAFLPFFLFPVKSFRVILSFILSIYVGWNLIGGLLAKNPSSIYKNILTILYTGALIIFINVVVNATLFNSIYGGILNPFKTGMLYTVDSAGRFSVVSNAVGLGYGLVFLILIAVNMMIHSKSLINRFLALLMCPFFFFLLLNTGSRGPCLTLFIIAVIILFYVVMSKEYSLQVRFASFVFIAFLLGSFILNWDLFIKPFITARSLKFQPYDASLLETFISSRLSSAESIIGVANQLGYNEFFGAGPGADTAIVEFYSPCRSIIETFFVAMIFNLGVIGGLFYILGMAALTLAVIKMERIERARGNKSAWLVTVWILMPWIASPFGYGFGIPSGGLCLRFAIGAGALVYCRTYAAVFRKHAYQKMQFIGLRGRGLKRINRKGLVGMIRGD